jgi:hypothetical protein
VLYKAAFSTFKLPLKKYGVLKYFGSLYLLKLFKPSLLNFIPARRSPGSVFDNISMKLTQWILWYRSACIQIVIVCLVLFSLFNHFHLGLIERSHLVVFDLERTVIVAETTFVKIVYMPTEIRGRECVEIEIIFIR